MSSSPREGSLEAPGRTCQHGESWTTVAPTSYCCSKVTLSRQLRVMVTSSVSEVEP